MCVGYEFFCLRTIHLISPHNGRCPDTNSVAADHHSKQVRLGASERVESRFVRLRIATENAEEVPKIRAVPIPVSREQERRHAAESAERCRCVAEHHDRRNLKPPDAPGPRLAQGVRVSDRSPKGQLCRAAYRPQLTSAKRDDVQISGTAVAQQRPARERFRNRVYQRVQAVLRLRELSGPTYRYESTMWRLHLPEESRGRPTSRHDLAGQLHDIRHY